MAGVLNNCSRPITLNCRIKRTGKHIKHRLNPTDFKTIPDGEWNLLKKSKVVQGYLDKGELLVGKQKHIEVPDDFEVEVDPTETEEELDLENDESKKGSEEGSEEEGSEEK